MELWEQYHYGDQEEFDRWAPEVRLALSYHLRDRPLKDQDNQKLLRMLRLAVIARKVSQCSKTWSGADAFATFTSVIQTLLKKGAPLSVVEALADLFRAPRSQTASV